MSAPGSNGGDGKVFGGQIGRDMGVESWRAASTIDGAGAVHLHGGFMAGAAKVAPTRLTARRWQCSGLALPMVTFGKRAIRAGRYGSDRSGTPALPATALPFVRAL